MRSIQDDIPRVTQSGEKVLYICAIKVSASDLIAARFCPIHLAAAEIQGNTPRKIQAESMRSNTFVPSRLARRIF